MAINWGPYSNRFRLGIEVFQSPGVVGAGTGQVSLTVKVWGESQAWGHNWTNQLTFGGAWNGSKYVSFYAPTGETVRKLFHETVVGVPVSYGQETRCTFVASVSGYGAANVSHTHVIAARPYSAPRPPRNPSAEYAGERRANVRWTSDYDGQYGAQPWWGVKVERRTISDPEWKTVAALNWNVTSFEDSTVPLNDRAEYRVLSHNGAGNSEPVAAGFVRQKPAPPREVHAVKAGANIVVSWVDTAPDGLATGFNIYDGTRKVGTVSASSSSWRHENASTAVAHVYTVTALAGTLESDKSVPSNSVLVLSRPNAPRVPDGLYVPAGATELTWEHNPTDATEQTRAQVRYRIFGTHQWTTQTVFGNTTAFTVTLLGGYGYEYQVRTWGSYMQGAEAGASPWSANQVVYAKTRPTARISTPTGNVHSSTLSVSWAFFQAGGDTQSAAEVTVTETATGEVIDSANLLGAATSYTAKARLKDGGTYQVAVRVRSSSGFWSEPDALIFGVEFYAPPAPVVTCLWDETRGEVAVNVMNPWPSGHSPAAVSNSVFRSVDGGTTWETVALDAATNTVVIDRECSTGGKTVYQVVAESSLPSSSVTRVEVETRAAGVHLNYGENLEKVVYLPLNAQVTHGSRLASQTRHYFAGRPKPVTYEGEHTSGTLTVSAALVPDFLKYAHSTVTATAAAAREFATTPGVKMIRDALSGRRVYGTSDSVQVSTRANHTGQVQIHFTEGDRQ